MTWFLILRSDLPPTIYTPFYSRPKSDNVLQARIVDILQQNFCEGGNFCRKEQQGEGVPCIGLFLWAFFTFYAFDETCGLPEAEYELQINKKDSRVYELG